MAGILAPLRRDQARDFASADNDSPEMVRAKVLQLLGTKEGELAWRTNFGVRLDDLRHQSNTIVIEELAKYRIREGFARWFRGERFRIRSLKSRREGTTLFLELVVSARVRGQRQDVPMEVSL